jgi:hypothetical protein
MEMTIEVSKRKSVFSEIGKYCHFSSDGDYIEVVEWSNSEGVDITIERKRAVERFALTLGEWELLQVLMNWKGE